MNTIDASNLSNVIEQVNVAGETQMPFGDDFPIRETSLHFMNASGCNYKTLLVFLYQVLRHKCVT